MSAFEIDAIYSEFSFLNHFLKRSKVFHAEVCELDEDFLSKALLECMQDNIYLVDSSGNSLGAVKGTFSKENVGQALSRLGEKATRVKYAVRRYVGGGDAITLYRLPQGYSTVHEWLNKQTAEIRKSLRDSN